MLKLWTWIVNWFRSIRERLEERRLTAAVDALYREAWESLPDGLCAVAIEEIDRHNFQETMCGRPWVLDDLEWANEILTAALAGDKDHPAFVW